MHFTPTYSSWINQVERFFAFITEELLQRRRPQQRPATGSRHPRLDHGLEHQPETIHLDQERRRDPRIPRPDIVNESPAQDTSQAISTRTCRVVATRRGGPLDVGNPRIMICRTSRRDRRTTGRVGSILHVLAIALLTSCSGATDASQQYPLHTGIVSTTFRVGEIFDPNASDGSQMIPRTTMIGSPIPGAVTDRSKGCQTERRTATNGYYPTG